MVLWAVKYTKKLLYLYILAGALPFASLRPCHSAKASMIVPQDKLLNTCNFLISLCPKRDKDYILMYWLSVCFVAAPSPRNNEARRLQIGRYGGQHPEVPSSAAHRLFFSEEVLIFAGVKIGFCYSLRDLELTSTNVFGLDEYSIGYKISQLLWGK